MVEADLKQKVKVRGGHKGYVTKTLTKCKEALSGSIDPALIKKLKEWKINLNERLDILKELDNEILNLIPADKDIEHEIDSAGVFRESIYEVIVHIDEVLEEYESKKVNVSSEGSQGQGAQAKVISAATTKLPKLVLKKFNGQPTAWQEFYDAFDSSIHKNSSLSDVDRFNYLRNLVEGPAYSTIAGLQLTGANYKAALNLLKERFGQKRIIINCHMENLMKIPPVYSSTDIRKVRKLYDAIEQNCRGLQALGVTSSSYGAVLVPVLLQKLPEDIKLELTRKLEKPSADETTSDDQRDLDHLLELLKGEVEARELCGSLQSSGISQDSKRSVYKNPPSTASALFSAGNKKSHASCTFCCGTHTTAECQVVTSLPERRNILL